MIQCFSQLQFNYSKSRDLLPIKCKQCNKIFYKPKNQIQRVLFGINKNRLKYCSKKCQNTSKIKKIIVECKQCNKKFDKQLNQIKKSKNNFCSKSCAAIYNNAHKKIGTRRSKLEIWIEKQLINLCAFFAVIVFIASCEKPEKTEIDKFAAYNAEKEQILA